jgi:hypothetical protein
LSVENLAEKVDVDALKAFAIAKGQLTSHKDGFCRAPWITDETDTKIKEQNT